MKIVIGLVGQKGSGKGTFTATLKELAQNISAVQMRFRDIISDILEILGLPQTRGNMQKLPVLLIQGFGEGTITNAMKLRLGKVPMDIVVLDGIRTETDAQMLKNLPDTKNILVYVTTDAEIRFKRMKERGEKVGEKTATWEQFLREEEAEIEKQIPVIGAAADYKITNNGSLLEYKNEIEAFYQKFIQPITGR